MNIQQIAYVIALSEQQNFGNAAEKCFVTQSTLSTMVSRFEDELGVTLFDRSTKPITITKEGTRILHQLRMIVKELDNLKELVGELKGELSGELRIGVIPTVAPYLLPLFLNGFIEKYPGIHFVISELTTAKMIADLENRELDIGILSTPLKRSDLIETQLYNEPFLFYDGANSTEDNSVQPDKIDFDRLLLLEEGHCLRTQVEKICELRDKKNVNRNLDYKSGTIDTLMRFVRKNKAVTLLPYLSTIDFSKEDHNRLRQFEAPVPARTISLVVHRHFVKKSLLELLMLDIQDVVIPLLANKASKNWTVSPVPSQKK